MRIIAIDRAGRTRGAILVACGVLAAAGCRPDYAKLEACTPAELVEIMRGGWRVNRGAAGAELSLLAMRKPEIVRPVAEEIRKLLGSPPPRKHGAGRPACFSKSIVTVKMRLLRHNGCSPIKGKMT